VLLVFLRGCFLRAFDFRALVFGSRIARICTDGERTLVSDWGLGWFLVV